MKTSIIILTFNKLKYTQQCIESIRKYTKPNNYEIIIVDNNSTDDTVGWLKQQTDIYTIYNTENMGFPSGCNQGIRVATGDEILLLNNDVMVTANWLENLRTALYSANDIGAVGPLGTNTYYQNFEKNFNSMNELQAYANMYNKSNSDLWEERLRLIGFCMLIRKAVIEKIGLLDERFSPGNYEDDDYSLRIRLAGYKLYLCKDTFIYHYGELSFRDNPNRYSELLTINGNKFSEKWGFNSGYSTQVREDVIYCVDFPDNAPLKVLEVGCSCGGTLLKLKNTFKNAEIYGIEINAQAARIAQLVADVIAGDIETLQLPYADNFFDYILFPDVLEHLRDPWNTVRNLKRYLKPGGQIIAS
jgi:GT2 family glycosyltransferase